MSFPTREARAGSQASASGEALNHQVWIPARLLRRRRE
jgi:hypothetical protein